MWGGLGWFVALQTILAPDFDGEIPKTKAPLVVFDFDGTLVDSFEESIDIVNSVAHKHNFTPIPQSSYQDIRNTSLRQTLKNLGLNTWDQFQIVSHYRKTMEAKGGENLKIQPGIKRLLLRLKAQGVNLAVVTTNSGKVVKPFLKHQGIRVFDFVYSKGSLFGKARLLKKIKKEASQSTSFTYVGDELRDVEAARAAGFHSIAVTWGFNTRKVLETGKPDHILDTPEAFPL